MKKIYCNLFSLLLLLLLSNSKSFAQTNPSTTIQWQKCIGGLQNDKATDILLNTDCSMIVVGSTNSNDGNISGHHGALDSSDALVMKLDSNGTILWQRSLGGNKSDIFNTVIATADGNYLCIGTANINSNTDMWGNFWATKIDPAGNTIWSKLYDSGTVKGICNSGVLTSDKGFAIIGTSASSSSALLLKLDSAGNMIWQHSPAPVYVTIYNQSLGFTGEAVVEDSNQNLLISGTYTYIYARSIYETGEPIDTFYLPGIYSITANKTTGSFSGLSRIDMQYFPVYSDFAFPNVFGTSLCKTNKNILESYTESNTDANTEGYTNTGVTTDETEYGGPQVTLASPHAITSYSDSAVLGVGSSYNEYDASSNDAYFIFGKFIVDPNAPYGSSNIAAQTFGGSATDAFTSIKMLPDRKRCIAVGYTNSKDGDVTGLHASAAGGNFDCWIVKLQNIDPIDTAIDSSQFYHNQIVMIAFNDVNGNGKYNNEPIINFDTVTLSKYDVIQNQFIPWPYNENTVDVDTGTYTLSISYNKPYYTTSAPVQNITLKYYNTRDTVFFPVTKIPGIRDYAVTITSQLPAVPNYDEQYVINYFNKGSDTLQNKKVYFILDNRSQFGYATPLPDIVSGDTLSWNIANLIPDNSASISFYIKLDSIPLLNINDTLLSKVFIDTTGDVNKADNIVLLRQLVIGSYDPNDKEEYHGGSIIPRKMFADQYLTYTIRFQNLGNQVASSVVVKDTLSNNLDGSSIQISATSHHYTFSIQKNKYITWSFNNINLDYSSHSDTLSKGYIIYKIKPSANFVTGDSILNSASIYFDFNSPIITNTQITSFLTENNFWIGATSAAWENTANWSLNKIPDSFTDVYINAGTINYPVINSQAACRTIYVNPAASIKINSGNLNVGGLYIPH